MFSRFAGIGIGHKPQYDIPTTVEFFDEDAVEDESDMFHAGEKPDGTNPDVGLDGDSNTDSGSTSDDDDNNCELDDSDGSGNESGFEF